jgi:hypothetical protein
MSESKDYKKLKAKVFTPRDRIDRIENVILVGMPDVNYCLQGFEGWIEMKSPTEPKRSTTRLFGSNHRVSQYQMNWALRQIKAKGRVFFLIVTDKRWALIHGAQADGINELTVQQLVMSAIWHSILPIKEEAWKQLRQALMSQ